MPEKGKSQPVPPKSPDSLQVHGKVRGVTRIGRKAVAAGAVVGIAVIMLIVVGAQNGPKQKTADVNAVPAAASPQGGEVTGHFGENVPIALPTAAPTPTTLPVLTSPSPSASDQNTAAPANQAQAAGPAGAGAVGGAPAQSAAQVEAAREAQERRVAAEAAADARRQVIASANHAPIIMAGSGSAAGGGGTTAGALPAAAVPAAPESPSASGSPSAVASGVNSTSFLNGPVGQLANGGAEHKIPGDRIPPQTPYEVVAGSVIPADLVTGINSQNPGLITGQVREDVYDSLTGKYLLIPRGSKLIGVYKNDIAAGQMRVLIAWKRLIFPDTAAIDLVDMSGADVEGNAGFIGRTDTHFGQLLAQTLLASIITAGLQLSQPQQQTTTTTGAGSTTVAPPGAIAAGSVGQSVAQALTQEIQSQSMIPPTITIPRGYPFVVVVDRDLVLTEPYSGGP